MKIPNEGHNLFHKKKGKIWSIMTSLLLIMVLAADSGEIGHLSAPNRPLVRAKTATPKRAWGVALDGDSLTQFSGHLQHPPFPRFSPSLPVSLYA